MINIPFTYSKKVLGVNTITGLDIELNRVILRKANYQFFFLKTAGVSNIGQNEWQKYFTYHYYPRFDLKDVCYMLNRKTLNKTDLENIKKAIELTKKRR